jgi:hypothetical protein
MFCKWIKVVNYNIYYRLKVVQKSIVKLSETIIIFFISLMLVWFLV